MAEESKNGNLYFFSYDEWIDFLLKFILFLIFLYFVARAYLLSITHDEALTILTVRSHPYQNIISYQIPHQTNNHLINSLSVKFFINAFGYHELYIRFLGLLGGLLFLIGSFKLCKYFFFKSFLFPLSFLALILNPYLIDFQSLGRGYSLSLGLMIISIYYYINSYNCIEIYKSLIYRIMSFNLIALATISNFSFLNIYLAIICSYLLIEGFLIYLYFKYESTSVNFIYVILTLLFIFMLSKLLSSIIYNPLIIFKQLNLLWGGNVSFYHDTVKNIMKSSLYDKTYLNYYIIENFFFIFLLIIIIIFIMNCLLFFFDKKDKLLSINKDFVIISLILGLSILSIIFQHIIFNTPFIFARPAIYFIPLFTLFVFILWKSFLYKVNRFIKIITNSFLICYMSILLLHYIYCFNLSFTYDWRYDASTKTAIDRIYQINKDINNSKADSLTIGASWWLVPAMNYYLIKHGKEFKLVEPRGPETLGPDGRYDYYYVSESDKYIFDKYKVIPLVNYDLSNTYLGVANNFK